MANDCKKYRKQQKQWMLVGAFACAAAGFSAANLVNDGASKKEVYEFVLAGVFGLATALSGGKVFETGKKAKKVEKTEKPAGPDGKS